MEPIEYLVVDVPPTSVGPVMELVGNRRAECLKMDTRGEHDARRVHDPGPRPDRPAHAAA